MSADRKMIYFKFFFFFSYKLVQVEKESTLRIFKEEVQF